jgi:hypothetical protein
MKSSFLLKAIFTGNIFLCLVILQLKADRIYILPGSGYDQCDPALSNAIAANGHTVVVALSSSTTLPAGFTSTFIDAVNGYDWLCIFGAVDYSGIISQVKAFIDLGGKVYYQHEVSCCITSSSGAAAYAASFTGLPIAPNSNSHIAYANGDPGWIAGIDSCVDIIGAAYKGMDSVPLNRQLRATGDLNGATPSYTVCPNFGMFFSTTDFAGTAHKGAFVALGDINLWYDGAEPPNGGGTTPANINVVNYFFPNDTSTCFLFPPGTVGTTGINSLEGNTQINIHYNHSAGQIEIKSNLFSAMDISVFNTIGEQVYFSHSTGAGNHEIKTGTFSKGSYFVRVIVKDKTVVKKVLIN